VQQDVSSVHKVEGADLVGVQPVDRPVDQLDSGSAPTMGNLEPATEGQVYRTLHEDLVQRRGKVDIGEGFDIETRHLRAAALELECPEAVTAPDVQRPLPAQVVRQTVVRHQPAMVEPARRNGSVGELDRVVPGMAGNLVRVAGLNLQLG
jgi:hypothetical protein